MRLLFIYVLSLCLSPAGFASPEKASHPKSGVVWEHGKTSDIFRSCSNQAHVYKINTCSGSKERVASGLYKICSSSKATYEIFSFFRCSEGRDTQITKFDLQKIRRPVEADLLVSELRRIHSGISSQKSASAKQELGDLIAQIRAAYPNHNAP